MTKFDDELGATLSADDRAFLEDLEDGRGMFEQLGSAFQGPMRVWTYLMGLYTLIFTVVAFFSGWQAIEAVELRETILWSAGCVISIVAIGLLKMWLFDRMNTLTIWES